MPAFLLKKPPVERNGQKLHICLIKSRWMCGGPGKMAAVIKCSPPELTGKQIVTQQSD
jgi:hypothetical protein